MTEHEAWHLPHQDNQPNDCAWFSAHRLHPFTSKDFASSVESTRELWTEALPEVDSQPSEASWRASDWAIAAISVGACAFLIFGRMAPA